MSGSFDAHDLRQAGTAAKRVHNQKAKWTYGGRPARCHTGVSDNFPITRPAKPELDILGRRWQRQRTQHTVTAAKIDLHNDVREALDAGTSESSGTEDHHDPAADATVIREFQDEAAASAHPYEVTGETIFKDMVDKAVEKYETKETEKLVKEYEVITRESEISIGYLADDDFELVDRYQL
ncbi:hypothetical protein BJY01DRAFT_245337 [Aspergillus pseudoustus]|uniref:Uncharacterized protein n=1 Tax=Aspergillus pseudoustus TaxID=1810923 RepID=A0ABR4KF34_9EURO